MERFYQINKFRQFHFIECAARSRMHYEWNWPTFRILFRYTLNTTTNNKIKDVGFIVIKQKIEIILEQRIILKNVCVVFLFFINPKQRFTPHFSYFLKFKVQTKSSHDWFVLISNRIKNSAALSLENGLRYQLITVVLTIATVIFITCSLHFVIITFWVQTVVDTTHGLKTQYNWSWGVLC